MFINLPYKGRTKVPGSECGFINFIRNNYLERRYYLQNNFIDVSDYENNNLILDLKSKISDHYNEEDIFIFGGDHCTTSFVFDNLIDTEKKIGIIIFDAHLDKGDVSDGYYNWNVLNCIEDRIESGMIIGVRHDYYKVPTPRKYKIYDDIEVDENRKNILENIKECIKNFDIIYVSLDVDVLNISDFPGVSFPMPGGLSLVNLVYFIRKIKNFKKIYGKNVIWDLVEYNPLIESNISNISLQRILTEINTDNYIKND
ncbi:arginase family protein [Streptococcus sp. ZY19097]|uniref:arginase family protein n=1 Tax=Streptococcus sp. ZY19097 TaxID=3231906 RepID=UPI00345955F3